MACLCRFVNDAVDEAAVEVLNDGKKFGKRGLACGDGDAGFERSFADAQGEVDFYGLSFRGI